MSFMTSRDRRMKSRRSFMIAVFCVLLLAIPVVGMQTAQAHESGKRHHRQSSWHMDKSDRWGDDDEDSEESEKSKWDDEDDDSEDSDDESEESSDDEDSDEDSSDDEDSDDSSESSSGMSTKSSSTKSSTSGSSTKSSSTKSSTATTVASSTGSSSTSSSSSSLRDSGATGTLNVPYINQFNPSGGGSGYSNGDSNCGPTSMSMIARFYNSSLGSSRTDAQLITELNMADGDASGGTDANGIKAMAAKLGLPVQHKLGSDLSFVDSSLAAGKPLAARGIFNAGGIRHFIVITGKNSSGSYTVNDPASEGRKTVSASQLKTFIDNHPEGAFFAIG